MIAVPALSTLATTPLPPSSSTGPLSRKRIEVRNLVRTYRGRRVVNGVSIAIDQGEIVGLLGPNGAGKTTTFNMIVGLVRPSSGAVMLNGENIARLPMYQRARRGIGYLAQEASVFRKLTARENILLVLEMSGYRGSRRARADALLEELHITKIANTRGSALSGGERRRVEIARALATNPAFLLLDEPFAGVDPLAVEDIQGVISGLRDKGIGILITDHDARATLRLTERAYILADGEVRTQGPSREVARDPLAKKYYLGETFEL